MNKTTNVLVAVIIGVLALAGIGFLLFDDSSKNDDAKEAIMNSGEDISIDNEEVMGINDEGTNMGSGVLAMAEFAQDPTESAILYELSDGSEVSYTVQKRFLSKEDSVVVGTTKEVSGIGWVDFENEQAFIQSELDFDDLISDSEKRDVDILPLFVDTSVNFVTSVLNLESLERNTAFSVVVPAEVTINGVTNVVEFDVSGTASDELIDATGTATINMSDFGVNPPTMAKVFSVDDETVISFTIKGMSIEDMTNDGADMEKVEVNENDDIVEEN